MPDAARRFVEADAHLLAFREDRLVEGLEIALAHVGQQQIPLVEQFIDLHCATDRPRRVAADGRMQRLDTDLGAGDLGDQVECSGRAYFLVGS